MNHVIAVGQPVTSKQKPNVYGVVTANNGWNECDVRWDTLDGHTERGILIADLIECEWCADSE